MRRCKDLIVSVSLKALYYPSIPVSPLLHSLPVNAPQFRGPMELFRELEQLGFSPHWEGDCHSLIWLRDPDIGLALLSCEQTTVTLH
jgi:hypothetical protein